MAPAKPKAEPHGTGLGLSEAMDWASVEYANEQLRQEIQRQWNLLPRACHGRLVASIPYRCNGL